MGLYRADVSRHFFSRYLREHAAPVRWQHTSAQSYDVPDVALYGTAGERMAHFSQTAPRQITLRDLTRYGRPPLEPDNLIALGEYSRVELHHRLALRVKAHHTLPYIVGTNPFHARIYQLYNDAYHRVCSVPPIRSVEDNLRFAEALQILVKEHTDNIPTLAQGFRECKRFLSDSQISDFLDKAIRDRISIRLIAEQHIALSTGAGPDLPTPVEPDAEAEMVGIVDMHCSPNHMISACASFVANLCENTYGCAPEWVIDGDVQAKFAYVPQHVEYILTELLKNAFRASAEKYAKEASVPPVTVTIASSPANGTVTLRIRDLGGGIAPENVSKVFTYAYTSVNRAGDDDDDGPYSAQQDSGSGAAALGDFVGMAQTGLASIAGYGYGLPLSRIYAQFFGGSLELLSLWPHGCDVFCTFGSLTEDAKDLREAV